MYICLQILKKSFRSRLHFALAPLCIPELLGDIACITGCCPQIQFMRPPNLPKRHLNLDYGSNAFKPKSGVAKGIMDVTMEVNEKVIYLWQQK